MGILIVANSTGAFLAAGIVVGCGFGTLIPLISALVADRSEPAERGRLFSLVMCGLIWALAWRAPFGHLSSGIRLSSHVWLCGSSFLGFLGFFSLLLQWTTGGLAALCLGPGAG
jgi:predicted MFS family arabinose efflux permease